MKKARFLGNCRMCDKPIWSEEPYEKIGKNFFHSSCVSKKGW